MATVLYFASLREQLGQSDETLDVSPFRTLGELKQALAGRGGAWHQAFTADTALLCAVNQQMANEDTEIGDGDEIAFFPPVTGG